MSNKQPTIIIDEVENGKTAHKKPIYRFFVKSLDTIHKLYEQLTYAYKIDKGNYLIKIDPTGERAYPRTYFAQTPIDPRNTDPAILLNSLKYITYEATTKWGDEIFCYKVTDKPDEDLIKELKKAEELTITILKNK